MSELLLRVALAGHADRRDVAIGIEHGHTVGDLTVALARHLGLAAASSPPSLRVERTGAVPDQATEIADVDLLSGDDVIIGTRLRSRSVVEPDRSVLVLDVTLGPDAGRSARLRLGANTIGRGRRCDVVLSDRTVSRHHATLVVGERDDMSIRVERRARNGVCVAGETVPVTTWRALSKGDVLSVGASRLVVRRVEHGRRRRVATPSRLGLVDFHRTPYRPPTVTDHDVDTVGPVPSRPDPRRLQIVAVLAPLAGGFAMFAVTGRPHFLLFTLMSPVAIVGTALDDRRSGRTNFRREVLAFRRMLTERRAQFVELAGREAAERHAAAPDVTELARRADSRTIDLWERGRDAPDFGRVRLGLGAETAAFEVALADGGDDDLRAEARATLAGANALTDVPVTIDLARHALGVHGENDDVAGVVAALIVQMVTLHSPDDLTIVAAVSPDRHLGWLKWLPHLGSITSPVAGRHLATNRSDADAILWQLTEVVLSRAARGAPGRVAWPHVLAVIDRSLCPDPAMAAKLLDHAGAANVGVVWLADGLGGIARQVDRILAVRRTGDARLVGRLWATDPAVPDHHLDVEHLSADAAESTALSLAAVRDASSPSLTTSIPRTAPLLDVMGLAEHAPTRVLERWTSEREHHHHLRFTVGVDASGPLELDLVADGPHTLIGGTSGAGKSELVQAMVVGLAANHPPSRLNFLFVDYKGGASSRVFERLPHTVGSVTNLSAGLARRALISLRAELQHRMMLLDGRAKDLAEMRRLHLDDAPASLVIVVDEFATLVKEVPEFVSGIVDIAQRGRSLGIHLVLATQRPSGSVDENILANTNLRISLRVVDRAESSAVIDAADAAEIPVPLRGRGFVRRGPRRLVEFQAAFGGAPFAAGPTRRQVRVGDFDGPLVAPVVSPAADRPPPADGDGRRSHLDVALDACVEAARTRGGAPVRRPWRPVLADVVPLDRVWRELDHEALVAGRDVVIGMLDSPESQEQRPSVIDLEASGGLLVFGTGGSGKTTLLRSIITGVERLGSGAATIVFDFASRGLAPLRELPSVIDVATGDDLEAVTRHLLVLDMELERRRSLLARVSADTLSACRADAGPPIERIVVVIDGFGSLAATLFDVAGSRGAVAGGERWTDIVHRLVTVGRQCGIHTVMASDRRAAVPARVQSAIGARLVLRHADPQSYADLGVRADDAATIESTAGRALLDGSTTVQIAIVGVDASARGQMDAIGDVANSSLSGPTGVLASEALPESVARPVPGAIGIADITGDPVAVDLEFSHAAIVGPPRSGRSSAVAAFAAAIGGEVYLIGPAGSGLAGRGVARRDREAFGPVDVVGAMLDRLASRLLAGSAAGRVIVCVDDLDRLDDPLLESVWQRLLTCGDVRLVASVESRAMSGYTTDPALAEVRRARRLLVLQPDDPSEFLQLTGLVLPSRPGLRWPPGRGVLVDGRVPTVVQVSGLVHGHRAPHDFAVVGPDS